MIDLKTIPQEPGCYLFKDKTGAIIYIGKARNLRARVSSYFTGSNHTAKTAVLIRHIDHAEFIIVDSEVESLLLENKLIKQHAPKYNISLKDAKTFAYILITDEKFPRILSTRTAGSKGHYFGPYTDGSARRELIRLAIRLFQLRVCRTLPKRACLNYHIGLCTAPCIKNVDDAHYAEQVKQAIAFLKGNTKDTLAKLDAEMRLAATQLKFELAQEKKRQIEAIHHLEERQKVDRMKNFDQDVIALHETEGHATIEMFSIKKGVISGKKEFSLERQEDVLASFIKLYYSQNKIPREIIVSHRIWDDDGAKRALEEYLARIKGGPVGLTHPERGEKLALVRLAQKNALLATDTEVLRELQERLILADIPNVIECFDISNLGYDYVVAGMTQWIGGKPNPPGYRRFRIRTVTGKNDDFASMREVVHRRYARLQKEGKAFPDLVMIDGGKGQLDAALQSLKELGLAIPIFALAKEREEIYTPHEEHPLAFNPASRMMLLVRAIRDSAHRFVIGYNRKRRAMRLRDDFRGIAEK